MSKILAYLPEAQRQLALREGIKLQISRSKQDDLLRTLSDPNTDAYRTIKAIAEDPILRCLFFLKSKFCLSIGQDTRVVLIIPLLMDYECDLRHFLQREDVKERYEKSRSTYERLNKELSDFSCSMLYRYYRTVLSDRRVINALKAGSPDMILSSLRRVIEARKDEFFEILRDTLKIYPILDELQSLSKILEFSVAVDDAQFNSRVLKMIVDVKNKDKCEQFFDALRRLAFHAKISIESLCLHCFYRELDNNPYYSIIENPKNVMLNVACPKCDGPGIVHLLTLNLPLKIGKLVYPDDFGEANFSWLNEFIIGFAAEKLDFVESIIIHKKLHRVGETVQKGLEVDVCLKTKDGELIIIEVTRQHNLDSIIEEISKKAKNLRERQIPYSILFYVTSHSLERALPLNDDKVVILGVKHIYKLDEHLEYYIRKA